MNQIWDEKGEGIFARAPGKTFLCVVENDPPELTEESAMEVLQDAVNVEEASMLLQTWSQNNAAVLASADRVEKGWK
jgi:hypothetical protein